MLFATLIVVATAAAAAAVAVGSGAAQLPAAARAFAVREQQQQQQQQQQQPVQFERKAHHRLLEFSPHTRVWVHEDEVARLVAAPVHNFVDVTDFQHVAVRMDESERTVARLAPMHDVSVLRAVADEVDGDRVEATMVALSTAFTPPTRYYKSESGVKSVHWLKEQYEAVAAKSPLAERISVELFEHANFIQPSLKVTVACTAATCADDVLIIGGHIDSITSSSATTNAPGADDDGSGSATVLEVFTVLAGQGSAWAPIREVQFHAYAAEEAGLLGSQDMARAHAATNVPVHAMLQLDMTAYENGPPAVIRDYTNDNVTDRIVALGSTIGFEFIDSRCGYACSDHASWYRLGFPAAFPFEAAFNRANGNIHTSRDTVDKLTKQHYTNFARVAAMFTFDLSSPL